MEYIAKDRSSLPPPLNLADIKCLCTVMHSVVIITLILITHIVIFITIICIVITTTTIIITVIFFVIIIIAVIETFPLFLSGKKRGISRRPLQGKQKEVNELLKVVISTHPSFPPSLPSILSCIMIANIFYLPLHSTEDFHNQASCVPISSPILGTQQLRIFSRYSNSKSKQRLSVALCRLGRNESCITTCAHSFG